MTYRNFQKINNRVAFVNQDESKFVFYKEASKINPQNFIYKTNKGDFYFKANGEYSADIPELFCTQIANKVGINAAQYFPAIYIGSDGKQVEGVASKDYITDRANSEVLKGKVLLNDYFALICGYQCTFDDIDELSKYRSFNNLSSFYKAVKIFAHRINEKGEKYLALSPNLLSDLKRQQLFYFLIANEDIYAHNIEFTITRTHGVREKLGIPEFEISLSPTFDCGISLLINSFKQTIYDDYDKILPSDLENKVKDSLAKIYAPFGVFQKNYFVPDREHIAMDMAKLLLNDPELMSFYNNFKAIDFKKLLENYKSENNYDFIPNKAIEIASLTLKCGEQELDNSIQTYNTLTHDKSSPLSLLENKDDLIF